MQKAKNHYCDITNTSVHMEVVVQLPALPVRSPPAPVVSGRAVYSAAGFSCWETQAASRCS